MPTTIVETATFDPTVEGPSDGEGATAASLKDTFLQRLTNRARYLYAAATTTGWWRLSNIASGDIDELRGKTVTGTGDVCYLAKKGIYRFVSGATDTEDLPWIVESDFGGRWFHELTLIRAANLATLSAGKVVQPGANQLIQVVDANFVSTAEADQATTTSGSWGDSSPLASVSLTNVAIGDFIVVSVHLSALVSAAVTVDGVRLAYEHNGSTTQLDETETKVRATTDPMHRTWVVKKSIASSFSPSTPHIFKVQLKSNGGDTLRLKRPIKFVAAHYRP